MNTKSWSITIMKKQNAYTIGDDIFIDLLEIIHSYFTLTPYAVVGGGAVQVYASSVAVEAYGVNSVKDVNGLAFMLRRTGHIDLSFCYDTTELTKTFNHIIQQSSKSYTYHNYVKRFVIQKGRCRMNLNYQTEADDLKGITPYYEEIIETAMMVEIPYKTKRLSIKICNRQGDSAIHDPINDSGSQRILSFLIFSISLSAATSA